MDEHAADVVLVEDRGPVRTITLNRPKVLNALNADVFAGLERAIEAPDDTRVLVIRGAGERAFCAGADLDELSGHGVDATNEVLARGQRTLTRIENGSRPVIAAVQGHALGGGFELALACHLRLASESARFGFPEAGLGLIPGYGGTQRLPAAIGRAPALAVMLAGRRLDARRAFELGLLSAEPVESSELAAAAESLAAEIAAKSPTAVRAILAAVRGAAATPEGLGFETALATIATVSADGVEGTTAFLEKRSPQFGKA